jgi:16S rRNA (cytidine1402-2'-O)-methyltransferase
MTSDATRPVYTVNGHLFEARRLAAGLHVVATPLGNLADISLRALSTLAAADTVLCEDTRVTSRLLQRYSISTRLRPYHDHNAAQVRPAILDRLEAGEAMALVSDAGMPAVSDPGFKLVRECIDRGVAVDVIPGPTAPVTALALSGLPTDRFLFAGFLPAKQGQRIATLNELGAVRATLIFFETGPRLAASLGDIAKVLPDRQVAVARELTKLHQEVLRGSAQQLFGVITDRERVKGEITLLIAPPSAAAAGTTSVDLEQMLRALLATHPASKAATIAARESGQPRALLYDLAVKLKESDR